MSQQYDIHELIDRYLNGEMGKPEMSEFEAKLRTDSDLLKTFEAQQAAHKIIIGNELIALKAQMAKDLAGKTYPHVWKYFAAATVVITTAIVLFLMKTTENETQNLVSNEQNAVSNKVSSASIESKESAEKVEATQPEKKEVASKKEINTMNIPKGELGMCSDTLISFSCQARAACAQKNDGAIEIDINTIKTGEGPFTFSVRSEGDFQSEPTISELKPGRYNLFVKDSKQCMRKLNVMVEVPATNCGNFIK